MSDLKVRDLVYGDWWETCDEHPVCVGQLVWAFIPHVDQIPYRLRVEGRTNATDHTRATVEVVATRIKEPVELSQLPVAALPQFEGERLIVQRAKIRPCIVVAAPGMPVAKALRGSAKWQTAPTLLVAPSYGVETNASRGGWNKDLIARIRAAEYSQYILEELPTKGKVQESVIRLDHIQPVGNHHDALEPKGFKLCAGALRVFNEWINWHRSQELPADSSLHSIRKELLAELEL